MNKEIRVNKFKPRFYQEPIWDAIENKGYKRVLAILPRRSGKDMTAFNLCIRECLRKVCVIYYIFPSYAHGRKILWDSITIQGQRILDYIPSELVESMNSTEMKIRFMNGSLFQIVGSDNYDSLMGTNPKGVVFSEYSLQDPRAYQYIRPILTVNGGWALFLSTPRGKQNHLWDLYQIALNSPQWFCYKLTLDDTQHVTQQQIDEEKADGIMNEELIQQEYYTSFSRGADGSYYSKYIDKMRLNNQIGIVPYEVGFKVHTVWDLGFRDSTSIIFMQQIGQTIRIIDYYENAKQGLEHYIAVLNQKDYIYGRHIAPFDIKVHEFTSGVSRIEKARQLGINFTLAGDLAVEDGIEAVRSVLGKCWIDENKCKKLIACLENYRQEWDTKHRIYKSQPLHDWSSHGADAFRYLAISLPKTRDGMTEQDLKKMEHEVRYGEQNFSDPYRHGF